MYLVCCAAEQCGHAGLMQLSLLAAHTQYNGRQQICMCQCARLLGGLSCKQH